MDVNNVSSSLHIQLFFFFTTYTIKLLNKCLNYLFESGETLKRKFYDCLFIIFILKISYYLEKINLTLFLIVIFQPMKLFLNYNFNTFLLAWLVCMYRYIQTCEVRLTSQCTRMKIRWKYNNLKVPSILIKTIWRNDR